MESVQNSGIGPARTGFHLADFTIFALVLTISISIGLYHAFTGGKQKTTGEYLMGNRQLKTVPVAMSILVSFISAILVLGTPAEMYTRGTQLLLKTVGYCLACVVSSLLFVPLFYRLNVTSSFEYLERRFKSKAVKLFGTVMMLIGQTFYMGLVMYTPSTALQVVTGFPFWASILIMGFVTTVYTSLGGMKAVVWTDMFQGLIMLGGMIAIVIQGCILVGGIDKVWKISQDGGRLIFFNFSPDPTVRLTFWSTVVGGMFHTLTIFGVGQTSVQRYCALPSLRQAQRSVYLNIPGLLIINFLAGLTGLTVYAYYASIDCDPLKMKYISNANQLVPYFIMDVLNYPGLPGTFLAVLFCGALSSMSSSLNAAAAVTWEDILKPCLRNLTEQHKATAVKVVVACYGCIAMIAAFLADKIGAHVLQASLSFTGATSGPSLGLFLLGGLFPWANAKGAIVGFLVSSAFNLWMSLGSFFNHSFPSGLPTSVSSCNNVTMEASAGSNWTSVAHDNGHHYRATDDGTVAYAYNTTPADDLLPPTTGSGLHDLYSVSFLWYSAIGALISIVVGLIVSFLTGPQDPKELDPRLVIPFFNRCCCCCPLPCRHKLECGVGHSDGAHLASIDNQNKTAPNQLDLNEDGAANERLQDSPSQSRSRSRSPMLLKDTPEVTKL